LDEIQTIEHSKVLRMLCRDSLTTFLRIFKSDLSLNSRENVFEGTLFAFLFQIIRFQWNLHTQIMRVGCYEIGYEFTVIYFYLASPWPMKVSVTGVCVVLKIERQIKFCCYPIMSELKISAGL